MGEISTSADCQLHTRGNMVGLARLMQCRTPEVCGGCAVAEQEPCVVACQGRAIANIRQLVAARQRFKVRAEKGRILL